MDMTPYWFNAKLPEFPPLNQDIEVDVAVIGGGLTGITAAWLLHKAGKKVALLERQRCAAADTGHTTAHLTFVTDTRLHEVVQKFGRDGAKAFWDGGAVAIDQIDELVRSEHIDCEFQWVPGYLHAALAGSDRAERSSLEQDAALANELGFQAKFLLEVPYAKRMGVRFEHQAQFHPRKYLAGLLQRLAKGGAGVYENSEVSAVENDPLTVRVGSHKVRCGYLVIATHCPIMGKTSLVSATLFQTKLALYTSYVLGARLPRDTVPQALYWDTSNPYYYLRIEKQSDHDYVIFGGEDSKTGQEQDAPAIFAKLERTLQQVLPGAHVQDRWLGQVVETNDGLPFIGESSASQFIATGFCGNGFTLGTLAAQMARDRVLGRKNPWFDLFDIGRKKILGGTWRYITENVDYPYYLLRDRLAKADVSSPDAIPFGEGRIAKLDGRKVAAYRDQAGKLHSLSPVCTHLGCIVHWNAADGTWDCPCHGSRFKPTGEVLSGPAEAPLGKAENT